MNQDHLNIIKPIYDGIRFGDKVTVFFILLVFYFIVNLLTSDINSGMSGGLEAEQNPYNQFIAGIVVAYSLFFGVNTIAKPSYTLVIVITTFLVYLLLCNYIAYTNSLSNLSISFFGDLAKLAFWISGFIFCMKCFRFTKPIDLKRALQLLIFTYLLFVSYRLFSQKVMLEQLGISAGINVAGSAYMIAPLILMAFKGKWKFLLYLFVAFICVYSAKRQAAAGIAIVTFFSLKTLFQTIFQKQRVLALLLLIAVIFYGSESVYSVFDDLNNRQEIVEGKGDVDSGRMELWEVALNGFERADNTTKLFGGGPYTGQQYIGEYLSIARAPHNGFVQILCDYGYIGLFLYVLFFLILLCYVVKIKELDDKLLYLSICFSWIFANIISHPTNLCFIFLSIGVGYIFYKQNHHASARV